MYSTVFVIFNTVCTACRLKGKHDMRLSVIPVTFLVHVMRCWCLNRCPLSNVSPLSHLFFLMQSLLRHTLAALCNIWVCADMVNCSHICIYVTSCEPLVYQCLPRLSSRVSELFADGFGEKIPFVPIRDRNSTVSSEIYWELKYILLILEFLIYSRSSFGMVYQMSLPSGAVIGMEWNMQSSWFKSCHPKCHLLQIFERDFAGQGVPRRQPHRR